MPEELGCASMCNALVRELFCKSSRYALWSVCHCIANKWNLLSFLIVLGLHRRTGDCTLNLSDEKADPKGCHVPDVIPCEGFL